MTIGNYASIQSEPTKWTDEMLERRHQAYVARLMAGSLTLMMYQTEREHGAHELQTKLVSALGDACNAAEALAAALDPDGK